jgi:hypothetical protein
MQVLSRKLPGWFVVLGCLGGLAAACSSDGNSLTGLLPADNEIESWGQTDKPLVLKTEVDLYNQIDGAGPKYLDRGWQGAVEANYGQAGQSIYVAIHDMGNAENAQAIFDFNSPISGTTVSGLDNVIIYKGAATCDGSAVAGRYYVQVNIDDGTDAASASVVAFLVAIVDRARARS